MKIVETDNYGSDYLNEKFVNLPSMCEEHANKICKAINDCLCPDGIASRFWSVASNNYQLIKGFGL